MVDALARGGADPGTHQYPSNRGRPELREAFARFYERRFGVTLDPETEIIPALGAKECVFNLNLAFLDPDDVALAADPGYPVYTGGPLLVGRRGGADAARCPSAASRPTSTRSAATWRRARGCCTSTTRTTRPARSCRTGCSSAPWSSAREHDVLIVHDASYTETTFDGYVAPSFLETPGAKEVGVEVFSLSKGWNMTGWRTAAIVGNADAVDAYWKLKTNIDSGMFEAVQLAAAAALDAGPPPRDARDLPAPPRPGVRRARRDRRGRDAAEGHDLRLGAGARGPHVGVLLRAGAGGVGRGGLARAARTARTARASSGSR